MNVLAVIIDNEKARESIVGIFSTSEVSNGVYDKGFFNSLTNLCKEESLIDFNLLTNCFI